MHSRIFPVSAFVVILTAVTVFAGPVELDGHASFPVFLDAGEKEILDAIGRTSVLMEVSVEENVIDGMVSVSSYSGNPVESGVEGKVPMGKFIGIHVSEGVSRNLGFMDMYIYYDEENAAGRGIDESTLRIYEWSVTGEEWRMLGTELDLHNDVLGARLSGPGLFSVYGRELGDSGKCTERWLCSDWGGCINGTRERICEDISGCGTEENKPEISEECEPDFFREGGRASGMAVSERSDLLVVGVVIFILIVLAVLFYLFVITARS